jgi:hypothetical protein
MHRVEALKALCGSESRYRLLRRLFAEPDREHHLRGLAAAAEVDASQAHKLLLRFVATGLCERVAPSPHPRYRASRDLAFQDLLKKLFELGAAPSNPMQRIEDRSWELHQAAIERIKRNPRALGKARATLKRWIEQHGPDAPQALAEWVDILARPLEQIAEIALQKTQYGDRIRKSSPLSPLVGAEERKRIYEAHRA